MRMIRTIALFFLCFFTGIVLSAQNYVIRGTITDSVSGSGIPGAIITLENSGTSSNALGEFNINAPSKGSHTVIVSSLGYVKRTMNITLQENAVIELNIRLKPANVTLSEITISSTAGLNQSMGIINHLDKQMRPVNSAQDLLTLVPGLFIAQHAGGGKAEQIFLRGFDCDHGTDFAVFADGIPVNMVSHAHGQGYADFHFVIPETVDHMNAFKGPYEVRFGDLATSGAGEFFTKNSIDKSMVKLEYGQFNTYRMMAMADFLHGKHLFSKLQENAYFAGEYNYTDSYFDNPQHFSRCNLFGKYNGMLNSRNMLTFSGSYFTSGWDASGQIPERAVKEGLISRYGSIDNSEGGTTSRANLNLSLVTSGKNDAVFKNQLYYCYYKFNLFSDFTFFLNDPVNGDEINQTEKGRDLFGYNGSYENTSSFLGKDLKTNIGIGTRTDAGELMLRHAVKRAILDTIVDGKLFEQNAHAYIDETLALTSKLSLNASTRFDIFYFSFADRHDDQPGGNATKARVSPKLNLYYNLRPSVQLFAHAGYGFHSNDARSVILHKDGNSLPAALGYEAGSTFKIGDKLLTNVALWGLDLQSELIYVGDEGVTESSGATRRLGIDLSLRGELNEHFFVDADLNYAHGRYLDLPANGNYIPLAPYLTSRGGIVMKDKSGFDFSLRYRFISSRPANENNSVVAKGYFLLDAVADYSWNKFRVGVSAENLLNSEWNQAQFDTLSRLRNESQAVDELHFTAGTPFFLKTNITFSF